jgi:hypothetical protein
VRFRRSFPALALLYGILRSGLNSGSASPASPSSPDSRTKRANPLVDLIDTEKLYVDQLTGVIRVRFPFRRLISAFIVARGSLFILIQKVASAWSRTNLPPHELDLMFRSIESVYKADRSLLSVRTFPISLHLAH